MLDTIIWTFLFVVSLVLVCINNVDELLCVVFGLLITSVYCWSGSLFPLLLVSLLLFLFLFLWLFYFGVCLCLCFFHRAYCFVSC